MNIMVTGGAGFIGTNLIKRLLKDGHNVVSIDNYSTGTEENHQEGCVYHDVDIRDAFDFDFFMENPDVIYHLAALPRIQPSFEFPALTMEIGVLGTMNILEWAKNKECKVIYAGSSSVHSGKFKNPYTFSKDVGEEVVELYQKHFGLKSSIARFYNVYGPHQLTEGGYTTLIGRWIHNIENDIQCEIYGDGEQRRDFTHIDDIVSGLLSCVGKEHKAEEFELGSGKNYSINEVADIFDCETTYIPERPGEYDVTLCDYSKAKKQLGYKPTDTLKKYITKWVEENKNV